MAGRGVGKATGQEIEVSKARKKAPKPSACKGIMQKRLAESFEEIVDGFVEEAKKGSCAHVKLTTELLETASREKESRKKGSAERMLEKWVNRRKQEEAGRGQGQGGSAGLPSGKDNGNSRSPSGMTNGKARATATADSLRE